MHLSGGSDSKESACSGRDPGSILGQEDSLGKEMATYSSTLAWRIPWTEKPGGPRSMGSLRVRHVWATYHFHFEDANTKYLFLGNPTNPENVHSPKHTSGNSDDVLFKV